MKHSTTLRAAAPILEYLVENHFLVPDGFEEEWQSRQLADAKRGLRIDSMYLVTTQACNFGCGYCAVMENLDSQERRNEKMSLRTGEQALELFARVLESTRPPEARVTFYGGEPMLNRDLIAHLLPLIRQMKYTGQTSPVQAVVITNGYVFDEHLVELLQRHHAGVCVSLDGTRRHQDVTRRTLGSSESTYDTVLENFRRYQAAGLSMGISTALGSHNAFDLPEISKFYATELKAPFVEFQIPYQVRCESNRFYVSTEDVAPRLMQAYEVLRDYGITEATTYRRLRDFATGRIRVRDCGASASQLVVAPDGSIGPCHSLVGTRAFFSGNVADSDCDPLTMDNFREWSERFPFNMPVCRDCAWVSLCGGGCIYNSYVSTGSIWERDPQVCTYMKVMVSWILRDLWKSTDMAVKYGVIDPCRGIGEGNQHAPSTC